MIDIEDRLRSELAAQAAQARPELLRPLRAPGRAGRASAWRGRGRARGLLIPVAAAAAVAAVVGAVSLISQAVLPGLGAGPASPSAAGGDKPPPYYVVIDAGTAIIRSSASGRVTGRVPLSAAGEGPGPVTMLGSGGPQIAGAGNGLDYVVGDGWSFYRLRVEPDGRSARLTRLPIRPLPRNSAIDGLALTSDGSRLAIAVQLPAHSFNGPTWGEIKVASTATGAVRTWTSPLMGSPWQLSWTGPRELGYYWQGDCCQAGRKSGEGFWLLNTTAPGRSLATARRLANLRFAGGAMITPDGREVIVADANVLPSAAPVWQSASVHFPLRSGGHIYPGVIALSTSTGKALRVLVRWPHANTSPCVVDATAGRGEHALVQCGRFGRVDNGRFTPLPGVLADQTTPVAW